MYSVFYGFREKPFTLLPDPDFLYFSTKHALALAMLEYGLLNLAGFTVITGEIGSGKTTLLRHLLDHVEKDVTVGLISNTHRRAGDLLPWILSTYGLGSNDASDAARYAMFADFVIGEYKIGRRVVLILDEAQNMDAQRLEELRLLSNLNADKDQLLQVILVGQPELRDTLSQPEMVQFAQRILVDFHLPALDHGEVAGYIAHRLGVAGADRGVFSDDAIEAIALASRGIPRLINVLCDTALVYGFAERQKVIDRALVEDVVTDRIKGGIVPFKQIDTRQFLDRSQGHDGVR